MEFLKLEDLEYNEIITLNLIEKEEDLNNIFVDEIKTTFDELRKLSSENSLDEDTKDFILEIFNCLILIKKDYVDKYKRLIGESPIHIKVEPTVVEEPIITEKPKKVVFEPIKKTKELPRRFGLVKIKEEITKQGGKATSAQTTAIALNKLKNINCTLNNRLVNDMLMDDKIYTEEDYLVIKSTVKIVENKLKEILKKR